ncbi:hypothetical protein LCGC14_0984130 [marine sediment metagenome]|uniref:Uncharacterized protein n=1 Tax=marine sediment metagenome TaxID=412755 RepID=A0A0F9QR23_9ZZZZ
MANEQKQTCIISVNFPVENDEQAIEYKKKITAVLSEMPNAKIQLMLMSSSSEPPNMPP